MYFSMQFVKHADSPLDSDVPGFDTHFSKQDAFIFYPSPCQPAQNEAGQTTLFRVTTSLTYFQEYAHVGSVGLNLHLAHYRFFHVA